MSIIQITQVPVDKISILIALTRRYIAQGDKNYGSVPKSSSRIKYETGSIHNARRVTREDSALRCLVVFICLRRSSSQGVKGLFFASWYKFHITKPLIVASISEELRRILKEVLKLFIADSSLLLQGFPVAIGALV